MSDPFQLKNLNLSRTVEALSRLSGEKKIPAALKWQAVTLKAQLAPTLEQLGKQEQEIIQQYAILTPEGGLAPTKRQKLVDGKPVLDEAGKVILEDVQNSWQFQDPTPAFVPPEAPEGETPEARTVRIKEPQEAWDARLKTLEARIQEFAKQHQELMDITTPVVAKQFPVEAFETTELTGDDLMALDILVAKPA